MATRAPVPASTSNDSALVSWLVAVVVVLVAALVVGGYWMQSQNQQAAQRYQQEQQYRTYLASTREAAAYTPPAPNPAIIEARETRAYLLAHPSVTPGEGFNQPGVQATGKAIAQAIDRAQNAQQLSK